MGAVPELYISAGSYDATVVGLHLSTDADSLLALEARFAYAAHAGSVRAVAQRGGILVSASSDETVRVYDVARRAEVAALVHHSGSVNGVALARDPLSGVPLLFSVADDHALCVTRAGDWRLLKRLASHTAPVTELAVHPSARVALTQAKDRSLFLWNLEKGKVAFSAKTKPGPASNVCWSPNGERYLMTCGDVTAAYTVQGTLVSTFKHDTAVRASQYLDDSRIVTGGEDGVVRIWDTRSGGAAPCATPVKHESRVRGLGAVGGLLVSADTAGGIKVWDEARGGPPRLETEIGGGGMRLTCFSVCPASLGLVEQQEDKAFGQVSKRSRAAKGDDGGSRGRRGDSQGGARNEVAVPKGKRRGNVRGMGIQKSDGKGPSLKDGTASSRKRLKRKGAAKK